MMVRLVGLLVPGAPPLPATVHRLSLLEVQENASGATGTTGSNLSEALSGRTTFVSQLVWPAGHVLQFCNAGGRCSLSQVGPTQQGLATYPILSSRLTVPSLHDPLHLHALQPSDNL